MIEEQIKRLIELQKLDLEIFSLEKRKNAIPEDIALLTKEFEDSKKALKEVEDKLKQTQLKQKEKEVQLSTNEEQVKKLQGQLFQLKTNKEYQTMLSEIGRIKADSSVLEEEILKIFDLVDDDKSKIEEEKKVIAGKEKDFQAKKQELTNKLKDIEDTVAKLKEQRLTMTPAIDKEILARYERILNAKNGLAVVPIKNEICQGCFMGLPPQTVDIARMKNKLTFCENCARIIYIVEE